MIIKWLCDEDVDGQFVIEKIGYRFLYFWLYKRINDVIQQRGSKFIYGEKENCKLYCGDVKRIVSIFCL